jgi:ABC-type sugar transport system permease subunit
MVGVPTLVTGGFIWFPTIASILLSFTNWDGIGGIGTRSTGSAPRTTARSRRSTRRSGRPSSTTRSGSRSWPSSATPLGLLLAYLLDKKIRGSRIYQSIFFVPVVLALPSSASSGSSCTRRTRGLINNLVGTRQHGRG